MALSDAQIERYSRQIILPEVGGTGQQRLLAATVSIDGTGETLATAARYLAGAGVGSLWLHGGDREIVATALEALGTEARIIRSAQPLGSDPDVDLLVAADLPIADLDRAANHTAVIAGGTRGTRGWLVVATADDVCASCAARSWDADADESEFLPPLGGKVRMGGADSGNPRDASPFPTFPRKGGKSHRPRADLGPRLASPAAGVIGALLALETVKYLLGLTRAGEAKWLHFDAGTSTLLGHPLSRAADCVCAAG